jgi:hypothetical protein
MNPLRALLVIVGLVLCGQSYSSAQEGKVHDEPPGLERIFNGKDLTGWDGDPKLGAQKEDAIVGVTTK